MSLCDDNTFCCWNGTTSCTCGSGQEFTLLGPVNAVATIGAPALGKTVTASPSSSPSTSLTSATSSMASTTSSSGSAAAASTAASASKASTSGLSTGAAAGIGVNAALAGLSIAVLAFLLLRKRNRRRSQIGGGSRNIAGGEFKFSRWRGAPNEQKYYSSTDGSQSFTGEADGGHGPPPPPIQQPVHEMPARGFR